MTEGWNIAVLGATGAVGEALLTLLSEREFPVGQLFPLASQPDEADTVLFNGKNVAVQAAEEFDWAQVQLAFFVASQEASAQYADLAAESGCLVIDSSGLFAMDPSVPLVVPTVNPHMLSEYRNRNIIAVAGAAVCQALTAVKPLLEQAVLQRLNLTNLQPASALGKRGVTELAGQATRLLNGYPVEPVLFPAQLAFNLLPCAARMDSEGVVSEERRVVDEVRKVLQDETLPVAVQCVQAPVFYGNAQAVMLETDQMLSQLECIEMLRDVEGIELQEGDAFPTPVGDATQNPHLTIGCVRNDYGLPQAVQFWSVADNVQFGGALMAVHSAELLIRDYL
ncbi:aspartate-semialdehyde dehydrogenase [Plesiomonas shigelloides]|uniref:aspartate-semialdehyde dehydrogenase n=1 Tax=Plesiomonas shigelloides TaxID=703 RepID=UPI000D8975F2|nr:aspartate-semialdehyde dehydrogenase [Plesiomonas shigelloides]KAB7689612.1 aspartate-semialdehyde dehydrogenase [Plesiomonas shigelloides]SPZ44415.1 USG-1 protein [Plesiomonas shigelloides]